MFFVNWVETLSLVPYCDFDVFHREQMIRIGLCLHSRIFHFRHFLALDDICIDSLDKNPLIILMKFFVDSLYYRLCKVKEVDLEFNSAIPNIPNQWN